MMVVMVMISGDDQFNDEDSGVDKDSCVGDSGSGLMREVQMPGDYFPRSKQSAVGLTWS